MQSSQRPPHRPLPIDLETHLGNTHSTQASSVASPSGAEHPVDALWNAIKKHRSEVNPTYFANTNVEANHTGVCCPDNADTVKVQLGEDKSVLTPIHANFVRLDKCYAVGQSPGGAFEKTVRAI